MLKLNSYFKNSIFLKERMNDFHLQIEEQVIVSVKKDFVNKYVNIRNIFILISFNRLIYMVFLIKAS